MTKNPFVNASLAVSYIIAVALIMYYGLRQAGPEDTVLVPIAVLSLFVLSAAMMGYLFFYQPVLLYLEGEKQQAVKLFVNTLLAFAGFTAVILASVFLMAV